MLNVLIAPDSFKDCLSASEVINNIQIGLKRAFPDVSIKGIPLSDGGEGLVESIVAANGGKFVEVEVSDPLMRNITAKYGISEDGHSGIIEMAQASGLELLTIEERNPMITSTFGTGQLIKHALDSGCRKLIIGIGGSATNDGGAGMVQALGAKLLDKEGRQIGQGGGRLGLLDLIDLSTLDERIANCDIKVACDVTNPLIGKNGASWVYGAQKGASEEMIEQLDQNLGHFASVIHRCLGKDVKEKPGAGAAGGMGAGLMALLNAKLIPGFDIVKELVDLEQAIEGADLIITGEGKIDHQTKYGKTPFGVVQIAKKFEKPVVALAGIVGTGMDELSQLGFHGIYPIGNAAMDIQESIARAPELLQQTAERFIRSYIKAIDN